MVVVPPEVRQEFEKWLDEYIADYTEQVDRFLASRDKDAMPVSSGSDSRLLPEATEPNVDAREKETRPVDQEPGDLRGPEEEGSE
jgi:hypothetical protein